MCLAAHDSEFRRWTGGVDLLKCQTFAASPAEPGELLFWFRSQSWQVAILLRLNALVPFNFQNYFFGATDIGLVPYTITTLLGIMPFTAMYVYLGTVGRTIAFTEGFGASNITLLLFSLLATAGLIYLVGRKTKKKLEEMTAVAG